MCTVAVIFTVAHPLYAIFTNMFGASVSDILKFLMRQCDRTRCSSPAPAAKTFSRNLKFIGLTQNLGQCKALIGNFSQTAGSTCTTFILLGFWHVLPCAPTLPAWPAPPSCWRWQAAWQRCWRRRSSRRTRRARYPAGRARRRAGSSAGQVKVKAWGGQ
jgi:hypothetical protein